MKKTVRFWIATGKGWKPIAGFPVEVAGRAMAIHRADGSARFVVSDIETGMRMPVQPQTTAFSALDSSHQEIALLGAKKFQFVLRQGAARAKHVCGDKPTVHPTAKQV